jgi:hypothetical protein
MVCTETASDPRVAGTITVAYNMRVTADGSWTCWGTAVIENAGGSLTIVWDGSSAPGANTATLASRAVGMGGHAGSTYIQSITLHGDLSTTSSGTIDPSP